MCSCQRCVDPVSNATVNGRTFFNANPMYRLARLFAIVTLLTLDSSIVVSAMPKPGGSPIVIIGIEAEIEGLSKVLVDKHSVVVNRRTLTAGLLSHSHVVLATCGVGKVNAAATAQLVISRFAPKAVIFTGTAGSLSPDLNQGDVVIAKLTAQYDLGELQAGLFTPWATQDPITQHDNPFYLPANPRLLQSAYSASCHVSLTKMPVPNAAEPRIVAATVVTGDTFIADSSRASQISHQLGAAAAEMEGGAVSEVCWESRIPCIIIRCVTDSANGTAPLDYQRFLGPASKNTSAFVEQMVAEIEQASRQDAVVSSPRIRSWSISFELPFGSDSEYSRVFPDVLSMPYNDQATVGTIILRRIVTASLVGSHVRHSLLLFGPGWYPGADVHFTAVLQVRATAEQAAAIARSIAFLAEQTEVLMSTVQDKGAFLAVDITGNSESGFCDQRKVSEFWDDLQRHAPDLTEGFQPANNSGKGGIRIIDLAKTWTAPDLSRFSKIIRKAAVSANMNLSIHYKHVSVCDYCNPWSMEPQGEGYLARLPSPLRSRMQTTDRLQVTALISSTIHPSAKLTETRMQPVKRPTRAFRRRIVW